MSEINHQQPNLLLVGSESDLLEPVLTSLQCNLHHGRAFRAIKKTLRQHEIGVLIFLVNDQNSEDLALQVFDYIRSGLQDPDRIFLVAHPPEREPDALHWIEDYNVNSFISLEESRVVLNQRLIERNLKSWERTAQVNAQHRAESDLLMSITRFSRRGESLVNLLDSFSRSLADMSFAAGYCHIQIGSDGLGKLKKSWPETEAFQNHITSTFSLPELPGYLRHALNEKKPQIDLLPDDQLFVATGELLQKPLGSYLVFPLVVYGRVHELMVFLIPEESMSAVSMRQIEIISKASEQLTMLLERREAERRLKKQYTRLKGALVELKETQEQLAHTEKMATVGQLAAGIAHEINNPLGFVLSNFGSMDEYLNNILQLQTMHEKFLEAMELGNQNLTNQIKTEISDYRGESDIDFIYSDIRDIVSESREGLHRVKEIISDLQSFAHGGEAKLTELDLDSAVEQTLKLLRPITDHKVVIDTALTPCPGFTCHAGFVQQILTNLIKNSLQAMQKAEVSEPKILIRSEIIGENISISVRDNGPGIAAEAQKKVFDPFFTTKAVGEGTGLGLSVTYNLAKKLGGMISLTSTEGEFCQFTLTLPHKAEVEEAEPV